MKKALAIVSFLAFIIACSNNNTPEEKKEEAGATGTASGPVASADPEVEKGLDLVAKSDCFTCHKVAEPSTGPAYEAVAAKYPESDAIIDTLAGKIINGGAGNWGTVPMTPHPDMSKEDAKTMVKYVLSLK